MMTIDAWEPIATAPKDGTWFVGRRGHLERPTQWGKTSHVPLYGWCHVAAENDGDPDYDLWEPVEWAPLGIHANGEDAHTNGDHNE